MFEKYMHITTKHYGRSMTVLVLEATAIVSINDGSRIISFKLHRSSAVMHSMCIKSWQEMLR